MAGVVAWCDQAAVTCRAFLEKTVTQPAGLSLNVNHIVCMNDTHDRDSVLVYESVI